MSILVDTSVWIDYFRSKDRLNRLDFMIDENLVATNDLILAELIPFLQLKKQMNVVKLLRNIRKQSLSIDWNEIIEYQLTCLRKGINGVGIPDLIIAQNAKQHDCEIYSSDKHILSLKNILHLKITE